MFRRGQLVLAKCKNYPFWPGTVQGYNQINKSYKIYFVGQNSSAAINQEFVIPFSQKSVKQILSQNNNSSNKKLVRSIELAMSKTRPKLNSQTFLDEIEQFSSNQPARSTKKEYKIREMKPQKEAHFLLQKLLSEIIQSKEDFSLTDETRLQIALDSNQLEIKTIINYKLIESLILVIKAGDTFLPEKSTRKNILTYLKAKYHKIKLSFSAQYSDLELNLLKKQILASKLSTFKAYL